MGLPELSEIKNLRKRAGFTQKGLAKIVGCSWSMIAKIEAESNIPSYDLAKRIFSILEDEINKKQEKESNKTAMDIMTPADLLVYALPHDSISDVLNKMVEFNISQMPVMEDDRVIGSITDRLFVKYPTFENRRGLMVNDVMENAFPTVSPETTKRTLASLLMNNKAVLISERGLPIGIVTKEDLIKE